MGHSSLFHRRHARNPAAIALLLARRFDAVSCVVRTNHEGGCAARSTLPPGDWRIGCGQAHRTGPLQRTTRRSETCYATRLDRGQALPGTAPARCPWEGPRACGKSSGSGGARPSARRTRHATTPPSHDCGYNTLEDPAAHEQPGSAASQAPRAYAGKSGLAWPPLLNASGLIQRTVGGTQVLCLHARLPTFVVLTESVPDSLASIRVGNAHQVVVLAVLLQHTPPPAIAGADR
jgi:hypothetical protein